MGEDGVAPSESMTTVLQTAPLLSTEYLIVAKWKYLVRDEDKNLYVFDSLPIKEWDGWCAENMSMCGYCYISKKLFGDMFDFIKWEDEKPWLIEDLEKLEVKEDAND